MALVAITLVAYAPAFHGGFLLDDDLLLTANPLVKAPNGWLKFWTTTTTPDYLPVMSDSFWLEWRLWGANPAGYHATNILLHAFSAVLFWLLLRRLQIPGAWFGALLFAIHPVNVRSVAWIAERKNTLSMVFYLSALLAFEKSQDQGGRRWYAGAIALFAVALFCKSSTVVLPAVLLIIAYYRRRRVTLRDFRLAAPFFVLSALACATTVWYQYHVEIKPSNISLEPLSWRLASAGYSVWFYLGKLALPVRLAMIYPRIRLEPLTAIDYLPTAAVAGALALFAARRRTWGAAPLAVFGYYVVALLPVLGFVNMAFFKSSMVSDHLQYIPMLGIAAAAGAAIDRAVAALVATRWGGAAALLPVALAACLTSLTFAQAALYPNRLSLALDTLRTNPDSFWAHGELANALMERHDTAGAQRELETVLRLDPRSTAACNNLAEIDVQRAEYADACALWVKAEQLSPGDVGIHLNLAHLYLRLGYPDEARTELMRAQKLAPGDAAIARQLAALTSPAQTKSPQPSTRM